MRIVINLCCGLDVHNRTVTACLLKWGARGRALKEVRTFETATSQLLELASFRRRNTWPRGRASVLDIGRQGANA
jgi:hypothetical protein